MSLSKINSALIKSVVDGAFGLDIAYENQEHTPATGTPYMEVYIIRNQPQPTSLGRAGLDLHTGFMQINLNYPANKGSGTALAKADEIRAIYVAGYKYEFEGQQVTVFSCGASQGRNNNGWYTLILTIEWQARTQRS